MSAAVSVHGSDAWHDGLLLGHGPMDRDHEQLVELIAALQQAAAPDLLQAVDALAVHACEHFDSENAWMVDSDFPARDCHIAEHQAVLRSIAGVRRRVAAGDPAPARVLATELGAWFPAHCDYLDAALAHWLCRQRLGGKPIVVRRQPRGAGA